MSGTGEGLDQERGQEDLSPPWGQCRVGGQRDGEKERGSRCESHSLEGLPVQRLSPGSHLACVGFTWRPSFGTGVGGSEELGPSQPCPPLRTASALGQEIWDRGTAEQRPCRPVTLGFCVLLVITYEQRQASDSEAQAWAEAHVYCVCDLLGAVVELCPQRDVLKS